MPALRIGEIEITPVLENPRALFPRKAFLPDAEWDFVEPEVGWLSPSYFDEPSDSFVLSLHSYLCRTQDRTVIIDACAGNDKKNRRSAFWNDGRWPYLENLADAGCRPEDVDLVLLTHLHVDHVGWCTRKSDGAWIPTFPNARYLCSSEELANLEMRIATKEDQYRFIYADSVKPVLDAGLLELVAMDHRIDRHFRLEPARGHTPGQVFVVLSSRGETAVATADVLHHPIQALYPGWNSRACEIPDVARETRRAFLDTHADSDLVVLPAHFGPSRIRRDGRAFRFVPVSSDTGSGTETARERR